MRLAIHGEASRLTKSADDEEAGDVARDPSWRIDRWFTWALGTMDMDVRVENGEEKNLWICGGWLDGWAAWPFGVGGCEM